jgi:hypothetical protein
MAFLALCMAAPVLASCGDSRDTRQAYREGDYETVLENVTPEAENGKADAQYQLGLLYLNGHGVEQDTRTAYKWFDLATVYSPDVTGDLANIELGKLEDVMSPQELVEAQAMSRTWQEEFRARQ